MRAAGISERVGGRTVAIPRRVSDTAGSTAFGTVRLMVLRERRLLNSELEDPETSPTSAWTDDGELYQDTLAERLALQEMRNELKEKLKDVMPSWIDKITFQHVRAVTAAYRQALKILEKQQAALVRLQRYVSLESDENSQVDDPPAVPDESDEDSQVANVPAVPEAEPAEAAAAEAADPNQAVAAAAHRWTICYSAQGHLYYYNTLTKERSSITPAEMAVAEAAEEAEEGGSGEGASLRAELETLGQGYGPQEVDNAELSQQLLLNGQDHQVVNAQALSEISQRYTDYYEELQELDAEIDGSTAAGLRWKRRLNAFRSALAKSMDDDMSVTARLFISPPKLSPASLADAPSQDGWRVRLQLTRCDTLAHLLSKMNPRDLMPVLLHLHDYHCDRVGRSDLGFNDVGQPDRFDNVGDENSEHAR
jgi:hypothetical protein